MRLVARTIWNVRTGLILLFSLTVVLTLLLIYVLAAPLLSPPAATSDIRIFRNTSYTVLADTVTVGKPTKIKLTGEKLYDISADVQTQIVCWVDGSENTVPLGTTYSAIPVGRYDFTRTLTIPSSLRVLPSESCRIQSSATYNFYQKDRSGELKSIPIKVSGQSNSFKLLPPEEVQ